MTTAAAMRLERIQRLMRELEYEVTRGIMEREIEPDIHLSKEFPAPGAGWEQPSWTSTFTQQPNSRGSPARREGQDSGWSAKIRGKPMPDTLRDRALKIAECPWAYASSDIAAVIQELLARLAATSSLPPHSRSADLSRPQNTSIS